MTDQPQLSTDPSGIGMLGINPLLPYYDLNLAGVNPLPSPPFEAPRDNAINNPTFTEPHMAFPPLAAYDLTGPGIDLHNPLAADPSLPDLQDYIHPLSLEILAPPIDPMLPDLLDNDRPPDLLIPGPITVDPALPDLQHPDLSQQVHMPGRPAELSPDALSELHDSPDYQRLPDNDSYEQSYMLQPSSTWRTRHLGTLALGLEREEGRA